MSALHSNSEEDRSSSPVLSGALLALTFFDTTWRMAVPSVGLTIVGLALDQKLGTKPWLMFVGVVAGSGLAIYLVRQQLKKVSKKKTNNK